MVITPVRRIRWIAMTNSLSLGALILCLLGGCKEDRKMAEEEIQPAELLQRAGGKLRTEPIASNEYMISVIGIEFADVPIGDADLAPVVNLPYLRTIVLRGTKVTDAGLTVFKDCRYLETVDLSHSAISGTGLHDLHFNSIKDLNLSDSKFGDRGIADVVELRHRLLRLNLAGTEITDEGMERLQDLRTLEAIDLSRTKISGAGLRYLPTELKQLNLSDSPIINANLVHLERLSSLENLNLSGTHITDDAIPHVQAMVEAQNLRVGRRRFNNLCLRKTAVSDKAAATLLQAVPGLTIQR
jgi:uncharacterized protein YjbI with pentapeptide repeats